jgi:hypothetical protein
MVPTTRSKTNISICLSEGSEENYFYHNSPCSHNGRWYPYQSITTTKTEEKVLNKIMAYA